MLTAGLALTGYKNIVSAEQADDDQSTEKQLNDQFKLDALRSEKAFVSTAPNGEANDQGRKPSEGHGLFLPKLDIPRLIQ